MVNTPTASPTANGDHVSSFMTAFSEKFGTDRAPTAYKEDFGDYAPPGAALIVKEQSLQAQTGTEDKSEEEIDNEYASIFEENRSASAGTAVVAAKNFNLFSCVVDSCATVASTVGYGANKIYESTVGAKNGKHAVTDGETDAPPSYSALLEPEIVQEETAPVVATF